MDTRQLSDKPNPILIGIDWGTTSFRAYLLARDGQVLDSIDTADGITAIPDCAFEARLNHNIQQWRRKQSLPIIMSGMITSRNGWQETPYLNAPAGATEFAAALTRLKSKTLTNAWLITGMSCQSAAGYPDVLRGEETEIIGHITSTRHLNARYLLPGTHSKWVDVAEGKINGFTTCMTGDVFAALRNHTILGATMQDGDFCRQAFERGVQAAGNDDNLLATLFSTRTLALFRELAIDEGADYLSGLLIGYEVFRQATKSTTASVTIIGRGPLCERYAIALSMAALSSNTAESAQVTRGHLEIATLAGII